MPDDLFSGTIGAAKADKQVSLFEKAMHLAATGYFRSVGELEVEMVRQKLTTPYELCDLPPHQRNYVNELCFKNSKHVVRR